MKRTSMIYGLQVIIHHHLLIDIDCAVSATFVLFYLCCNFMYVASHIYSLACHFPLGCGCFLYVDCGNMH